MHKKKSPQIFTLIPFQELALKKNRKVAKLVFLTWRLSLLLFKKADLKKQMVFQYRDAFLFLSLLSDSNQRPRDYKSRALAN